MLFLFRHLSADPAAPTVLNTIRTLNQDPNIAKASYELSLLQILALGVRAIWPHDTTGKVPDILVPVASVRSELDAGRQHQVAEFTAAHKDAVANILSNDDPRKGSA